MPCKLLACCRFFDDHMKNMPEAVHYIKKRLCFDDYASCRRYILYNEHDGKNILHDLDPDSEEVIKIIQCLQQKETIFML